METFQFYFELIGAAAFAISGAALGIRKEMDLFGVAMLGMTTAVGGGMLRDTMLGLTPPAALRDPVQALVAIAVSILVFFVWRRRKAELHNRYAETVLLLADSLGLGIFSAHGAAIAIQAGYGANWFLVLFMGMLTGVGGGVLRDVCSAERPYIFTKHVYACASLAGAAVCLLLWPLGAGAAMMTGCGVTLALRICAAAFRWRRASHRCFLCRKTQADDARREQSREDETRRRHRLAERRDACDHRTRCAGERRPVTRRRRTACPP